MATPIPLDVATLITQLQVAAVATPSRTSVESVMRKYDGEGWKSFVFFDEKCPYTRNLIYEEPGLFSLMLLCWNPAKSSPIHDHSGSDCFMRLLQGSLVETRHPFNPCNSPDAIATTAATAPTPNAEVSRREMKMGDVIFINDKIGCHSMGNPSTVLTATSLHLYLPPYRNCRAWCQSSSKVSKCDITFYSVNGCKTKLT
jgi:cysteine dioxygenase